MSLYINHNLMAANAARNLSTIYGNLSTSVQRLSSGLRINSAADDAAGLAVRELMRADIAVINQGIRNASDAISMIQTAEGAMSVIDEKLIRMKELAEQAATGTYTTAQRLIMDSEYQAMAAEIDRIASATDFNGIKLLDGTMATQHDGSGLKVHFGTGNDAAEDYYFVSIGDMKATSVTGLQVGQGSEAQEASSGVFRTTGLDMATTDVTPFADNGFFGIQTSTDGTTWDNFGFVKISTAETLTHVVDKINGGNAAVATVDFTGASSLDLVGTTISFAGMNYVFSSSGTGISGAGGNLVIHIQGMSSSSIAELFQRGVNDLTAPLSGVDPRAVASFDPTADPNTVTLYDYGFGASTLNLSITSAIVDGNSSNFSGGGTVTNITAAAVMDADNSGYELQFTSDEGVLMRLSQPNGQQFVASTASVGGAPTVATTIQSLYLHAWNTDTVVTWDEGDELSEWFSLAATIASTVGASWDGADILTQSAAQLALAQIDEAINRKDTARANLGALQNRLENTITNLQIQAENLQASESRISDVDVALEMTEFTRNNIMTQAAVSMLAQANSLPQLALQLLG